MSADRPPDARRLDWVAELRSLTALLLLVFAAQTFVGKFFYIPSDSMMPLLLKGDRLAVSKYPYGWSHASVGFRLLPPMAGRLNPRLPERGDVVTFEHPVTREDYIKRVIGLPGEVIAVADGVVSIDGVPVRREMLPARRLPLDANLPCSAGERLGYRRVDTPAGPACEVSIIEETLPNGVRFETIDAGPGRPLDDFGPYRVPAGHLFVMGDNRDNSADSRATLAERGLGGAIPFATLAGRAELVTFSLDGTARWYDPASWVKALRADRSGRTLRPAIVPLPARGVPNDGSSPR